MTRPLRKEFENAWYHIMNRGAGRKRIYTSNEHKNMFLTVLSEAHDLFGIEIHAYCLMNNHYHLLIRTPRANLSRAMRHINGVYTQRFNRLENTDGPLFRGRYKSIIISYNEYFLNVSRYIHLNPSAAKILKFPEKYPWSSCQYFYQNKEKPHWLYLNATLSLFDEIEPKLAYQKFIMSGVDSKTKQFYDKINMPAIFGSDEFKSSLLSDISASYQKASLPDYNRTQVLPTMEEIVSIIQNHFNLTLDELKATKKGKNNTARSIAIYGLRMWAELPLISIAKWIGGESVSNISNIIYRAKSLRMIDCYFNESINSIQMKVFSALG